MFFVCFLATVESYHPRFTYKRDAEENEHHILNILKDHDIIPDIIDDATHTDILEVSVNMVLKKKNAKFNKCYLCQRSFMMGTYV